MTPRVGTDDDSRVVAWVERHLGGRVRSWTRQPRWRPVWFLDVERSGGVQHVLVRGDRPDTAHVFDLEHEMRFQQVLHVHGIPVPEVFGLLDAPRAYAMEALPGRPDFEVATDAERDAVVDEYLQVLARLHALPVEPFARAGIASAPDVRGAGHVGSRRYVAHYRATKVLPDPLMEFALGWLRRHPLPPPRRQSAVVWDSGQFHHLDGHLVGLVDLELGHVGDPMMDLAAWRMRDTVVPFGDFAQLYDRYAELSGHPVDVAAVQWHHLFFTLSTQLYFHARLARPTPDTDYMAYAQWVSETNLHAVETLAEYLGVGLEPVEVPGPAPSPAAALYRHLGASLHAIDPGDEYARYRLRAAFRLVRHLQRRDEIGAAVAAADREDLARLVGRAPATPEECDAELERFVLADDGAHDEALVVLFYRRWCRYKALMGPPGSAMARHYTLQPLGRSRLAAVA